MCSLTVFEELMIDCVFSTASALAAEFREAAAEFAPHITPVVMKSIADAEPQIRQVCVRVRARVAGGFSSLLIAIFLF